MLRNFLIFSLFFVAIHASGELTLLNVPSSLSFKGNDALQSKYVGDLLYACLGNAVPGDVEWSGLTINSPFELPKHVMAIHVDGSRHFDIKENAKSYSLQGSDSEESLSVLSAQLSAGNSRVCNFNLKNIREAEANFGHLFETPASSSAKSPQVAFIENIANNFDKLQNMCDFFYIRANVDEKDNSETLSAAIAHLSAAIEKSTSKDTLVVAIANKAATRTKREVVPPSATNKYNLAKYYDEDYPAIFNIIFWFMVVFFLTLLAICYALAYMDPGRDSIIYRMTSTRMKKEN